jgi:7-carboxy-7-deazaguanine synthase (Cx14CxxC type)
VTYAVKEIFYTLQGEGANAGRPAVFLRFSGCNLWTGLDKDRDKGPGGCSRWCDTNFVGTDGTGGGKFKTPAELVSAVSRHWPGHAAHSRPLVVCTGGEPLLQLDTELAHAFRRAGFNVAIETNGTMDPPEGVYWITVSPKAGSVLKLRTGNELKLVYPQPGAEPELFQDLDFRHFYLQPMDGPTAAENTKLALQYCLEHPQWRLSLQTHKLLGIP